MKDWHFLPKDLFAADIKDVAEKPLAEEDIDRLYEEFLSEVDLVQTEQKALLRCLIKHHGLRRIFCEGLTDLDLPIYRAKIAALRTVERQIPEVKTQLQKASQALAAMAKAGEEGSEDYHRVVEITSELEELLYQHRLDLLQVGAAGQLYVAGEIEEVVPLDDAELLQRANPVAEDGGVKLDKEVIEARQDAQARAMIEDGKFALAILGGAHDLSDNLARLTGGTCEYITVTTQWCRRFGADDSE